MKKPDADEEAVIFLLFPDLAARVFPIDWERMEFSTEAQTQIRNVLAALANYDDKLDEGWDGGYNTGWMRGYGQGYEDAKAGVSR